MVQSSFLPSALKESVPHIENLVTDMLPKFVDKTINTLCEMKKYAFDVAIISAFGINTEVEIEQIKQLYRILEKGYNSMPLNVPGTPFHKAMRARKLLNEKLRKLIGKERKSKKPAGTGGLLEVLLSGK